MRNALRRLRRAVDAPPAPTESVVEPQPLGLTYLNVSRYRYFERFFDRIRDVEGDIVECGVGYGDSLIILGLLAKREGRGRRVWGFDSFEGFPEPTEDDRSVRSPQKGQWASDLEFVRQRLLLSGLDDHFINRQATLIRGYFDETLHLFRGKQIALLHLDCDLYASYKTCLGRLYPLVPPGGVVCFDEYVNTMQLIAFPGAQKAIDEFLGDDQRLIESDPETGQYFLVRPAADL